MAKASTTTYGNDSISMLKGAERVRKRPSVIFGSDGLEGCEHAVFEILSNAIDEAREGFGNIITVTRYEDKSIEVEDLGRGCPVDWNEKEQRYNWELIFCEMYAGGKYKNNEGENYEYSLGLNGLGACATQYASEYMDVTIWRDGKKYSLHFRQGEVVGGLESAPADRKKTGTTIRWRPDLEVFTDIDVPESYFQDVLHRQAVVNKGVTFRLRVQRGLAFVLRLEQRCPFQREIAHSLTGADRKAAVCQRVAPRAEAKGQQIAAEDFRLRRDVPQLCLTSPQVPCKFFR